MLPSASASPPSRVRLESTMDPDARAYSTPPTPVRIRTTSTLEPDPTLEEQFAKMATKEPLAHSTSPTTPASSEPTRTRTSSRTSVRAKTYPYVVAYPDGLDPDKPKVLPVARQFEADGTFTDLYIRGHLACYDADCVRTGSSHTVSDRCAASQGKPPDPKKALALEYQRKYE